MKTSGWWKAASVALIVLSQSPRADAGGKRGPLDPLAYRDALAAAAQSVSRLESVEQLGTILSGSDLMGPGEGWFHSSQMRHNFKWLARRFDKNGDGRITADEMKEFPALFARLDRDGDGIITAADFDWSDNSPYMRQMGMIRGWMGRIDRNSNGRLSKQEWLEFFEKAAKGKDHLTPEDLREALMATPRPTMTKPPPGPSPEEMLQILVHGTLTGELGSLFEGPGIGERAPGFTLKTHDGKQTVHVSDYRGKKPVVLIFGSFT
jgi:Ca2+-binding EF-hand superfamily protein